MNPERRQLRVTGFPPKAPLSSPMPAIITMPVLGRKAELVPEFFDTDLLVLTMMQGTRPGGYLQLLDEELGGVISRAKEKSGFRGELGSTVWIDLRKEGIEPARPRYILFVGLGDPNSFSLPIVCGLMRIVLEKCGEHDLQCLTMSVIPNRLSQHSLNLIGTGSIIRCRVEERYAQHGGLASLQEIRLLCTPQARKHLDDGLACPTPRCPHCPDPRIDQK